jgi:hypothetical protein
VQTTTRLSLPRWGAAFAFAALLRIAGCGGEHPPGEPGHGNDEHAGHVIPAHKPKTFPDAARRLRELNDGLVRDLTGQKAPSSSDQKTLQIALDIANWLPEIAADSDMPEGPWNKVNAQSAAIVADYQAMLTAKGPNDTRELVSSGKAISELERVLAAADPRWFGEIEKKREEP